MESFQRNANNLYNPLLWDFHVVKILGLNRCSVFFYYIWSCDSATESYTETLSAIAESQQNATENIEKKKIENTQNPKIL